MTKILAAFAAAAVVLLAGCGGSDEPTTEPTEPSLAEQTGCDSLTERETEEIFVRELFTCEGADPATMVYTFNNTDSRDSWLEIAETFGVIVIDQGDTWLKVEEM